MLRMLLVAVCLQFSVLDAAFTNCSAQGIKLGIKGGINNTEMSFDKDIFDSSRRYGWFAGPALKVNIIGGLGFDIAALYDQKELKLNDETIKHQSVLVPVNLRLNLGLGSTAGIYLTVGPQFGFYVGSTEFNWKDKSDYENTFQLNKSNLSANFGGGIYLSDHLEVGFTYNIALGKTADVSLKDALKTAINDDTKAKAWTISACYYF